METERCNTEPELVKNSLKHIRDKIVRLRLEIAENIPIYVFGSLGRRIAMSSAPTWQEYSDTCLTNPNLHPRLNNKSHKYDVDVAVPNDGSITWSDFSSTAKEITKSGNPKVEIDIHFVDLDSGGKFFKPRNHGMSIKKPVNFEINSNMLIMGDTIHSVEVPDRWTFLLMYASINRFRPKDIPEVINLAKIMHLLGDFRDKDRLKLFYKLILGNKKAFSPYHAIRYMLQSRLTSDGRNERQLKSFEKLIPVFF